MQRVHIESNGNCTLCAKLQIGFYLYCSYQPQSSGQLQKITFNQL